MYDLDHEKIITMFNVMLVGDESNSCKIKALEILKQ